MLKIALGQMEIFPGNPRKNAATMLSYIKDAKTNGADIIVFPELCISGYLIGDLWEQKTYVEECIAMGEQIKKAAQNIVVIFGNVGVDTQKINYDGRIRKYNALYVAQNGKFIGPTSGIYDFYIKTLAPNYRFFNEARHFTTLPEVAREVNQSIESLLTPIHLQVKGKRFTIAPLICEDSWVDNYPLNPAQSICTKEKPNLYINISCSPFTLGKNHRRNTLFVQQEQLLNAPLLYVNAVSLQNNGKTFCTFDGQSTIYKTDGTYITPLRPYQNGIAYVNYDELLTVSKKITAPTAHTEVEEIYNALTYGIRAMTNTYGITKVVIGISGGIDSAVNAALYTKVLGPENVFLVTMPSQFNSKETQNMALTLAERLGCPFTTFPIKPSYDLTIAEMNQIIFTTSDNKEIPITLSSFNKENIQARDRSARILAGISSALGAAFTCNGNKTELTAGYATLYGDLAGFLAATADLWKFQIYELAHYLNTVIYKSMVIPEETIHVIPSAELSETQDITQGKGDPIKYEYHDKLFRSFIEPWNRFTPEDILISFSKGTLEAQLELSHSVQHYFNSLEEWIADLEYWWNLIAGFAVAKRIQAPPLIAISRRAYGGDLQESQLRPYYTDGYYRLKKLLLSKKDFI